MTKPDPSKLPDRSRPIHQPTREGGNRSVIVFVTVCTKDRKPLLASPEMHRILLNAWGEASHWLVGQYAVLPDHIHLFCAPGLYPPHALLNWVRFWKSQVAKRVGCGGETLWQKNFWDTQLRKGDSYRAKWEYVRGNPVRHQLVQRAEDWPYQGEMNILPWQD